jgi:hypothetical protein
MGDRKSPSRLSPIASPPGLALQDGRKGSALLLAAHLRTLVSCQVFLGSVRLRLSLTVEFLLQIQRCLFNTFQKFRSPSLSRG